MGLKSYLDAATSESLTEDNVQLNFFVVDAIRAQELPAKDAFNAIRLRMKSKNPNVMLRTLSVLEAVVKNCGAQIQCLVAQKDFMDDIRAVINSESPLVRKKGLELIQMWGHAFKDQPNYKIVPDTLNSLRAAGFEFPPFDPNTTAMFVAEKAPDWVEGEKCSKCQAAFTMFNRRHHCRNCGGIFCQKCSSKTAMLPRFAIETEVRVCDFCYDKLKGGAPASAAPAAATDVAADLPTLQRRLLTGEATDDELMRALARDAVPAPRQNTAEQDARMKEEEELQLAMALSISEAQTGKSTAAAAAAPQRREPAPRVVEPVYPSMPAPAADDAVARYSTMRKHASTSSTTSVSSRTSTTPGPAGTASNGTSTPSDDPLSSFLGTLRLLEQRMDAASQAGRHLSTDPAAQTLYRSLLTLHREVLAQLDLATRREGKYLAVQAKQLDVDAAFAQAEAEAKAHVERLQQQQREQELLAKMQLEQKMKLLEAQQREQREYQRAMDHTRLGSTVAAPSAPYYPPQGPYAAPAPPPAPSYVSSPAPVSYGPPASAPVYGAPTYQPAPAPTYAAPAPAPAPQYGSGGEQGYPPAPQYGAAQQPYAPQGSAAMSPSAPMYRLPAPAPAPAPAPLTASVYAPVQGPGGPAPVYGTPSPMPPGYGGPAPAPAPAYAGSYGQGGYAPQPQQQQQQHAPTAPSYVPQQQQVAPAPPAYALSYAGGSSGAPQPAVSELISFD